MSRRLALWALYAFAVGLALHNLAMATLWDWGVRGAALDVVAAWKEALLAVVLVAVVVERRGLPFKATPADGLALAYGAVVLLYAVIPQDWLGGEAGARGILLGLRHDLLPVGAYFLGRSLELDREELRRVALVVVGAASAVAAFGLVEVYAVSLDWWRTSGVPGWYREQLGLDYGRDLSGLPENFVYNTGDEERPLRRLVSTFLSPLATAFMLVVALLAAACFRRLWIAAPLLAAGLLWTYSRSAIVALAVGLVVLAVARRRWWPVAAAVAVVVAGVAFVKVFPEIGPVTSYTQPELVELRRSAAEDPDEHDPLSFDESSIESHWTNLRDGVETVVRHPQGYGLGNAGVTAFRSGVDLKAGESTYAEIGVDAGLLGLALFVAWSLALLFRLVPRSAWVAASLAAVLALGLQTDVIGVPWLAFVLWSLAGSRA